MERSLVPQINQVPLEPGLITSASQLDFRKRSIVPLINHVPLEAGLIRSASQSYFRERSIVPLINQVPLEPGFPNCYTNRSLVDNPKLVTLSNLLNWPRHRFVAGIGQNKGYKELEQQK